MPTPLAQQSKQDLRDLVAYRVGDYVPLSTSSAGNGGGTTAVFASLAGKPAAGIINRYLLILSGTNASEWRVISDFDTSNGTVTVARAFTGQVASGVTARLHAFRPDLYTLAINQAIDECYRALYRPVLAHVPVWETGDTMYGLPRNMVDVGRVLLDGRPSRRLYDFWDRDDSATDPGGKWTTTNGQGTWGITGEALYSVTDADADLLLAADNPDVRDGVLLARYRGTLNSGSAYRTFSLYFRMREDHDATPDTDNALLVRLLNGVVDLRKRDGGTESSLTTGSLTTADSTDYLVRVMFQGPRIRVWVDDVEYITYELQGLNLKYLQYGHAAIRLDKAGSPATAARLDDYRLHELVGTAEVNDWRQSYDGLGLELSARGNSVVPTPSRLLWIEGTAPLTKLSSDTTFETLAADTTDVVELESTDPANDVLVNWAAWKLYEHAAQPSNTVDPEDRRRAIEQLPIAEARARETRDRKRMRRPRPRVKHP